MTVTSWLTTKTDGLATTGRRIAIDAAMGALCSRHRTWACWWFGGLIADHMRALPVDDPWRSLSAAVGSGRGRMVRGDWPASDGVGAIGLYGRFGASADGMDLIGSTDLPSSADPGLTALADGLTDLSAALLAFAADGWATAGKVAEMVTSGPQERRAFALLSSAASWAMWRHRCYVGHDDPLPMNSGHEWVWRADELTAGRGLDWAEGARIEEGIAAATPEITWEEVSQVH